MSEVIPHSGRQDLGNGRFSCNHGGRWYFENSNGSNSVPAPIWWTPEQQFDARRPLVGRDGYISCECESRAEAQRILRTFWKRRSWWSRYKRPDKVVTVDLNTGEEIPA